MVEDDKRMRMYNPATRTYYPVLERLPGGRKRKVKSLWRTERR